MQVVFYILDLMTPPFCNDREGLLTVKNNTPYLGLIRITPFTSFSNSFCSHSRDFKHSSLSFIACNLPTSKIETCCRLRVPRVAWWTSLSFPPLPLPLPEPKRNRILDRNFCRCNVCLLGFSVWWCFYDVLVQVVCYVKISSICLGLRGHEVKRFRSVSNHWLLDPSGLPSKVCLSLLFVPTASERRRQLCFYYLRCFHFFNPPLLKKFDWCIDIFAILYYFNFIITTGNNCCIKCIRCALRFFFLFNYIK